MHKTFLRITTVGAMGALLAACAGGGDLTPPPNSGTFKIGVPYEVGGDWYYPKEEPDYDETGVASWYGPTFYGHRTADGEVFDATAMTAAHRTLPMPVNVRVTNLDNGRTAVLRVNDRGPFARGRIIDVSEHAAEVLGFKNQGTAHVRVQYLARADGNAPAPNFDDNSVTPQSRTPMAPVASAREPGGSSIASAPVGVVQAAALGATTVMTSAGPVMMQHVPPPDPIPAAPIPSFSTPASSGNGQPTQLADSSEGPASAGIASNDLPPLPASGQGSLTGSDLADSTGQRSDLTPMVGGDPNAPAPPPLIDHSDDPGAGTVVSSAMPSALMPPAESPAKAAAPAVTKAAAASTIARTRIYVQAGAFSSRTNADHLISILSAIGSFFISPVEKAGAELYRVRMGPFDDVGEATAALARVTGLGNTGARIVVDQ